MRMMKRTSPILIFAFLLLVFSPKIVAASSEKGEWIEHPFDYPSLGTVYALCGEDCLGVTRAQSTSILFFDINASAWTELTFDTQQVFHDLEAEGHTVFAFTDEFLIGYSAYTSDYDVKQYVGTLLEPSPHPSYGCGKNLAFFVTNEMMYVFDAELGHWQQYDYGLPADYANHTECIVKDDYIWLIMSREPIYEKQPKNVVYSLHTHSFNQLENGCWRSYAFLDHGFARWYEHGGENYTLIGYSAFTNEFAVTQVSGQGYLRFSNVEASGLKADEITAYAVSFRQVIELYVLVRADFYGYDTRIGSWSHTTVDFHYNEDELYSGSWQHGGQFVIDMSIKAGEIYNFILYSGITGQFSIATPGITYHSVTSGTPRGGEVLVAYDIDDAWGHSFTSEESSMISIDKPNTASFPVCGDDFCIFSRYSEESETMTMYIYNSNTNSWTTISLPKQTYSDGYAGTEHTFTYTDPYSPTRVTVFYSSFLDTYVTREFPADSYVWQRIGYALAWASSSERSYLYDAKANALYEFDFEFVQNGLGDFAATFFNAETGTLYGYSTLSRQWTNLTIEDTPYTCRTKGFVGLVASNTGTQYSKYYAYNGLEDSWVELVPAGSYYGDRIGQKTALVIRSNMLYAFDPNGPTRTYNYSIEFDGSNYPVSIVTNSTISNFTFNQSLKEINFNVTGLDGTLGFCNLTLPNTLVQDLWQGTFTVLVDGEEPIQMNIWTDETHTYVYFTYVHSEHEVVMIPEFQAFLVLPLFIITTLVTAMVCRRRITII